MIPASTEFRVELSNDNRAYVLSVKLLLPSGQTMYVDNSDIWSQTLSIEDMVNQSDVLDLGSAIINKMVMGLNNITEKFSGKDFVGGIMIPSVGLVIPSTGRAEMLQKGIFVISDAKYDGSIVTLTGLDLMSMLDKEYTSDLTYPATLRQIVDDACEQCKVTIDGVDYPRVPDTFDNEDYVVSTSPAESSVSYREVISWGAQIAGSFARVDRLGKLTIKWFNVAELDSMSTSLDGGYFDASRPYASGDSADGGNFMSGGDSYDGGTFLGAADINYITECFSTDVAVEQTEVGRIKVYYSFDSEGTTKTESMSRGDDKKFTLFVQNNDFVKSKEQATTILNFLYNKIAGMKFFRADITHVSDPCIEAGDVGLARNFRGNFYPIIISRTKFAASTSQTTNSNAESDEQNISFRSNMSFNYTTGGGLPGYNPIDPLNAPEVFMITGPDGDLYAIYFDPNIGNITTERIPIRIYYVIEPVTAYFEGDTIDVSGAVVHAVFSNGDEIDVTSQCTFSPAQGDPLPADQPFFQIVASWSYTPGGLPS